MEMSGRGASLAETRGAMDFLSANHQTAQLRKNLRKARQLDRKFAAQSGAEWNEPVK